MTDNKPTAGERRKIYVASSWRNGFQPEVVLALRNAGHDVYDFRNPPNGSGGFAWSDIDDDWLNWTTDQYAKALNDPIAIEGFNSDFDGMKWADTCVMVLPCGRSANTEAGWMKGAGKIVYVYSPVKQEPELMYKIHDGIFSNINQLLNELSSSPSPAKEIINDKSQPAGGNPFKKWLETKDGKDCMKPANFVTPRNLDYLENRLWYAFTAGMGEMAKDFSPAKESDELETFKDAYVERNEAYNKSQAELQEAKKEIERLKSLLREVCVRANIIFPEQEPELDWFDEQFANQHELLINIGATLELGEIDEESKESNKKILSTIKKQFDL